MSSMHHRHPISLFYLLASLHISRASARCHTYTLVLSFTLTFSILQSFLNDEGYYKSGIEREKEVISTMDVREKKLKEEEGWVL